MAFITLSALALACKLNSTGDYVNEKKCMNTTNAIKKEFYSSPEVLEIINGGLIDCKNTPSSGTVRSAYIVDAFRTSLDTAIVFGDIKGWDTNNAVEFIAYGASGYLGGKWDCKSPRLQN